MCHANEKKAKFGSTDGTVCRLVGPGAGRDAGPLAGSGALLQDPVGRGGLRKGRFTVETAAANPDMLLIAMERVPDAMVVAMEKARELDLRNVFLWISMWHGLRTALLPANWTACT